MRTVVIGLGIQGDKRQRIAGNECIATVDPFNPKATAKSIEEVALDTYDAALVCTPDEPKYELLKYLLKHKKHVLVEKPLWCEKIEQYNELNQIASLNDTVCYTAYNHRFEPHFVNMQKLIEAGTLGKVYHCRMFYGNGTARLVRESAWRDSGAGVLPDLGSHLLDTLEYWFGSDVQQRDFNLMGAFNYENKSPDHAIFASLQGSFSIEMEVTLLSWRNHFSCDIYAEKGSAHIQSLCKWGPSTFTVRERVLPSGRPIEKSETLVQADPTWELEYDAFKSLVKCRDRNNDLSKDKWIHSMLSQLGTMAITKTNTKQPELIV